MAQIVIFVPKGEDASAGKEALEAAGHEVEIVDAKPEVLLHMALGMMEGGEEAPAEEVPAEEEPVEEVPTEEEPPAEEAEVKESHVYLGKVSVDGEQLNAYLGRKDAIYGANFKRGEKTTYSINESTFSVWSDKKVVPVSLEAGIARCMEDVEVKSSKGKAFIVLREYTARALGLM